MQNLGMATEFLIISLQLRCNLLLSIQLKTDDLGRKGEETVKNM